MSSKTRSSLPDSSKKKTIPKTTSLDRPQTVHTSKFKKKITITVWILVSTVFFLVIGPSTSNCIFAKKLNRSCQKLLYFRPKLFAKRSHMLFIWGNISPCTITYKCKPHCWRTAALVNWLMLQWWLLDIIIPSYTSKQRERGLQSFKQQWLKEHKQLHRVHKTLLKTGLFQCRSNNAAHLTIWFAPPPWLWWLPHIHAPRQIFHAWITLDLD